MFLTVIHVVICIFLVIIVLLQQGRGADMGATFGGGSNTLFGAGGADNLLTRVTTITAFMFMLTSILLTYRGHNVFVTEGDLFNDYRPPQTAPFPASSGDGAAKSSSAGSESTESSVTDGTSETAAPAGEAAGTAGDSTTAPSEPVATAPAEGTPVDGSGQVQASPSSEAATPAP